MLSYGASEQSSFATPNTRTSSGRIHETNTENLLRMVSYCENDVDCRRFLQLVHFGEKFDSSNCRKTCDNCLKAQTLVDKDVTDIAKQLVELVKLTRQQVSAAHVLDVYRGSMSQIVKKYKHDKLSLHGAGKHIAKGEASRVLRHLVVEEILVEDVKKSDLYGSVSSIIKVNENKAGGLLAGRQTIILRFPSASKPLKSCKNDATPARSSLTSTKQSSLQVDASAQPQPQSDVDLALSAKLFSDLRKLRTILLKGAGDGLMAYHIFGNATLQNISKSIPRTKEELLEVDGIGKVKVSKYGDKILETIEASINEYYKTNKNNSSSSKSSDSVKRRRNTVKNTSNGDSRDEDDDFVASTARSKKKKQPPSNNPIAETYDYFAEIPDEDLDFYDSVCEFEATNAANHNTQHNDGGRVLPSW